MKYYWPSANRITDDGREERLFTQESAFSEEKAREQIDIWKNGYGFKLREAWIDVIEDNKMLERIEVEV